MKKTVKSILCSLFMAFLAINPAQSQQGTAGSLDWEIADGILTISGKGGIPAYSETRKAPWSEYKDSFTAIVIEDGVTQIRDYAFYDCPAVVSVSIGDSVINIGQHAFARCSKLASVAIPGKTSKIDAYAFDSCTSLESVEIFPESATLGAGLFRNCTGLKKITCHAPYGYGISTQSPGVFEGVDLSICTLYVPAGAATMYEMMGWNGFGAIKTIGEEEIGGEAGPLAWDLTDGMLTISGQGAMPAYTESNKAPWDTYKDQITSVSIKDGVTSIGDYAFYGCSSIVSVNIGQNVATIGRNAFAQCTGLTSILIPASVTRLNGYAFEGCSSLASIEILTQSAYFDSGIFRNCTGLQTVTCHATYPYMIQGSVFEGIDLSLCTLRVPAEAMDAYGNTSGWKDFGTIEAIGEDPCAEPVAEGTADGLNWKICQDSTLTITGKGPMRLYSYGEAPWYPYREAVTHVTIGDEVTSIGHNAFADFAKMTSISLPAAISSIGNNAFQACIGLVSIELPAAVGYIGQYAFAGCFALTHINVHPDNILFSSENGLVFNKEKTETVCCAPGKAGVLELPQSVRIIGNASFAGCPKLGSVVLGDSIRIIGEFAFSGCTGLTSMVFPDSIIRFNRQAFDSCIQLETVEIFSQSAYFDSDIFRNCKGLKMVINHATKPQTISHSVFSGVNLAGCTLRIPAEAVGTYRQAEVWKDFGSFQTLDGMPAFDYVTDTVNGVSFDMAFVPGGTFTMGGTEEQGPTVGADEFPIHSVTLDSFLIGATEVTQELWLAVMGVWPTSLDPVEDSFFMPSAQHGLGDNYPAYYISWNDAQLFLSKLNELTGKYFRLPTESEWEYAARGAKNDSDMYSGGNDENIDEIAWYKGNNDYDPTPYNHPVATKKPNELGLYDMSGNVLEWCSDWYTDYPSEDQTNPTGPAWGTSKVNRGGHSMSYAMAVRTAIRYASYPEERSNSYGFRIVRDFRTRYKVSLSANIPEGGMVAMQGNSTDGMFLAGETVVLMAIPNMGYTFVNWTENGEVVSTEASYTFTIESDRDLMANFALEETEEKFSVRFNTPENGTLSILAGDKPLASGDSVAEGTEITITAAPAQEYVLDVLQLNGIDIENGHTHAVTTDVEILASFKLRTGIENGISKNIRVYPNPVKDMLDIEASVDLEEVRIYSLDGRLTRQAAHPQSRIDMSGLPSGLYLLRIKAAGNEHIVNST